MKEKVLKAVNTVHNASRFVKLICFVGLCLIAMVISLVISGARFAYKVNYGGNRIAIVGEKSDFDIARVNALNMVEAADKENLIYNPEFSLVLTLPQRIDENGKIADAILDNTNELVRSTALCVNGENVILYGSRADLEKFVNARLNAYNVADYENKCEFLEKVEYKDIYCKKSDYSSKEDISKALANMSVKTTVKYTTDVVTDFSTVTEKTASKLIGYCEVKVEGQTGINHEVEQVELVNGVEKSRVKLAQEVVKKPIDKVILVGTGTTSGDGPGTDGMMFPLPKNVRTIVTTYFGAPDINGHVHKGIDYAVPKNTPIYAAKGGTVTRACYRSDYGNCIVINHGNGVQTLYAHCNELYVKEGEEVKQGQTIGAVGTTGQSTGFHLHFELMVNGGYVNPSKYASK